MLFNIMHGKPFVSIHAPTWGATVPNHPLNNQRIWFQSTLPRGERQHDIKNQIFHCCFNPRSHVGSDVQGVVQGLHRYCFNPRSHVGSDCRALGYNRLRHRFQSTLPRGERRPSSCTCGRASSFQSTLPRGERRALPRPTRPCASCFNPRSHEGSDWQSLFIIA